MLKKLDYTKIYYYSYLCFAFTLPLSRGSLSFFSIFLLIVWLIEGNLKDKFYNISNNKILIALALFLFWSFLSCFWSENSNEAINKIIKYRYLLLPFIIYTTFDKNHINKAISLFLSGIFISEIISYGVYFGLWQFKHASILSPSPFMMHIDYSIFLAFSSILLLNRLLYNNYTFLTKVIYSIFFLTVTGNLFLQIGRTGQISYMIAIVVLMIIHFRITFKSIIISILTISLISSTAYKISPNFQNRVFKTQNEITTIMQNDLRSSIGIRISFWIVTYNILSQDLKTFLIGTGFGDYSNSMKNQMQNNQNIYTNYKLDTTFISNNHPHNQYLTNLLQSGFIGFSLFLLIFYYILKKQYLTTELKELSILFSVIFLTSCLTEPLLFKQFTLALVSFFIGIFSL